MSYLIPILMCGVTDASAVLEKVVKHRLYGLITVFLDLGADAASIKAALRMAAIQGDDVAISVLLGGLSRASAEARSAAWEFIPEVASLAERLGFTHVHARLQALLEQTSNSPSSVGYNDYVPFAWESHVPADDSCTSSLADNMVDAATGYASFKIAHTLSRSAGAAVDESAPAASMGRPVCAVDRIPIGSITPEAFFTDYVLLNRPVVLLAATDNSARVEEGSSVWTLDNLLKQFGKTKDVSSAIPYATLFGHSEVRLCPPCAVRASILSSGHYYVFLCSFLDCAGNCNSGRICEQPDNRDARVHRQARTISEEKLGRRHSSVRHGGGTTAPGSRVERRVPRSRGQRARTTALHLQRRAAGELYGSMFCLFL